MVTSSRDFTTYTSCKACGNTTKTEHGECATCGALKPTSPAPAPEAEIARLHAELANARLERDNVASLNSYLIAQLVEARRALLAGNDTVLANKKLQEDTAALKARIAQLETVKIASTEINAMPSYVRGYIAALETACDPNGTIRENYTLREENLGLRTECTNLRARAERAEKQ